MNHQYDEHGAERECEHVKQIVERLIAGFRIVRRFRYVVPVGRADPGHHFLHVGDGAAKIAGFSRLRRQCDHQALVFARNVVSVDLLDLRERRKRHNLL